MITLNDPNQIITKKNKIKGNIRIEGGTDYDNYEGSLDFSGRGNNSWRLPKKPFKIKLESQAGLFGLPAAKKWILLAEYHDGTMLYNGIPFNMGKMLGIPFTNTMIPVNLYINGKDQGLYVFTESKEVRNGRIDLDKDGILLEMDRYFDEKWKFESKNFNLPVMVQYPKEDDMDVAQLQNIQTDFETMESLIFDSSFPNNNYLEYLDDTAFINYMLVFELTNNREINIPKSIYLNKQSEDSKYRMGILWDFDWAFGFEDGITSHYDIQTAEYPLLLDNQDSSGTVFFKKIMSDVHMQQLFNDRWQWFKVNKFEELKDKLKDYSEWIRLAYNDDHLLWGERGATGDPDKDLQSAINWLDARARYMNNLY